MSMLGHVIPASYAGLGFRMSGRVDQVLVAEGDSVKAGQPLVILQADELKATLREAQAELGRLQAGPLPEDLAVAQANLDVATAQIAAAQAKLEQMQGGAAHKADLAAAQAQLAQAEAQLQTAQTNYDLVVSLGGERQAQVRTQLAAAQASQVAAQTRVIEAQTSASDDVRAAQADVDIATSQRAVAQAQLARLKVGAFPEQIQAAQARVAQAQAALDEATLTAPFDGTIAEMTIRRGEIAAQGVRVASIADLARWQVETDDLTELEVVSAQLGADVNITVDALPGVNMHGRIQSITPRSAVKDGDITYTAQITIVDPDPRLKWGMSASVHIART